MAAIGQGVTHAGYIVEDFSLTWVLTGSPTQTNIGQLMQQDTAVARAAKVGSTAAAEPLGILASVENRVQEGIVVGTIDRKGGFSVAYTGTAPVIGGCIACSATPGVAQAAAAGTNRTKVTFVDTTALTVEVLFD